MTKQRVAIGLSVLLVSLFGLRAPLGAQVDLRDRAREALPPEAFEQISVLAAEAEAEGIPTDPLFGKAVEGVAKGIPTDRILPAVVIHVDRLRVARGVLGAEVGSPVIVAGADALAKGVPSRSLGELRPTERTSMALLVLGDLIQAGVPADEAIAVVREALSHGAADQAMLTIRPTVQRLLRDGRTPTDAADAIRRALRDGRPIHRVPGSGLERGGLDVPTAPGAEPVTRDGRSPGAGGGG